ncbi:gonadotropin subunit beta-2-like [Nematolebias whitei]|uniref:gonadotropin subunit beta-2-like n=1 Tax=Nematolebias whitei TaxID=451745 RepID=UPI001896B3ED|nr:gonadotropin subunit beta-2-like [Nematolebias whitei]
MMAQICAAMFPLMLSLILGASSFTWILTPAAAFQLPICHLVNQTISLEKEGCFGCHPVETTICSGHCFTKYPIMAIRFSKVYQHVCTYQDMYYKTFELPDCLPGVDPIVTYPMALSCSCGRCTMDTSDCTFESLNPDFCMNYNPVYY